MESIFESLENLQVSEGCFNSIISIVEEYIHEFDIPSITLDDIRGIEKETEEQIERNGGLTDLEKDYLKKTTKNQRGENATKRKQFPKSYSGIYPPFEPDKNELETERDVRRSAARHKKKTGVFESLENLNVSEECFNSIMDIVEEIISENAVDDSKEEAANALKPVRRIYNSGVRHYKKELKKLPGRIKKAIKDFDTANSKKHNIINTIRDKFKTPEGEKAHEIFGKIKNGSCAGDEEQRSLIRQHRELQKQHNAQVDSKIEKATKKASEDTEKKRRIMGDLRSSKNKERLIQGLAKSLINVDNVDNQMQNIKSL